MAALLLLMLAVGGWHLRLLVRGSAWVKNPYIKKCFLEPTAPKATRGDVQASLVVALDRAGNEGCTCRGPCISVAYFPGSNGRQWNPRVLHARARSREWSSRLLRQATSKKYAYCNRQLAKLLSGFVTGQIAVAKAVVTVAAQSFVWEMTTAAALELSLSFRICGCLSAVLFRFLFSPCFDADWRPLVCVGCTSRRANYISSRSRSV